MPARRGRLTRVGGRRRKASDERTRGKAVSAWRAMGIWRRSGFGEERRLRDRGDVKAANDWELPAAAALEGPSRALSMMSCRRS